MIINGIHILSEAMGDEKRLLLSIQIPEEDSLEAIGRVIWYDLSPEGSDYRFRAGVLFTEIGGEVEKRWQRYLSGTRKRSIL